MAILTSEEKQLLIKDLCARLPYGALVFIRKPFGCVMSETEEELTATTLQEFIENDDMHVFPYLRPMSSMTEEEAEDYIKCKYSSSEIIELRKENGCNISTNIKLMWLNVFEFLDAHHFDYRGLIPMGMALEAPEGMYKM